MSRLAIQIVLPLLSIAAVGPARADVSALAPTADAAPRPDGPTWYGWQVLAVDAASLGTTVGCLASDGVNKTLCQVPLAGYLLGGPTLHTVHQGWERGAVSLGMRVALPVLGGLIGASAATCPSSGSDTAGLCGLSELGLGMLIGTATAVAVDSIWAFNDAETAPRAPAAASPSLSPALTLNRDSAGVGLSGRF